MFSPREETHLAKADKVAQILNVDKARVYELARTVLPPGVVVRIGRQVRFDLRALREWLQKGGTIQ
jgi:phage terminase Nu1 subunit (DNA packaging protein)